MSAKCSGFSPQAIARAVCGWVRFSPVCDEQPGACANDSLLFFVFDSHDCCFGFNPHARVVCVRIWGMMNRLREWESDWFSSSTSESKEPKKGARVQSPCRLCWGSIPLVCDEQPGACANDSLLFCFWFAWLFGFDPYARSFRARIWGMMNRPREWEWLIFKLDEQKQRTKKECSGSIPKYSERLFRARFQSVIDRPCE